MSINYPSDPNRNNMPQEKPKSGIRASIRTKITLWAGLCLALVSLVLIGYAVFTLRQTSIENSQKEAVAIADAKAITVKDQLDTPLIVARTLARSFDSIKDSGIPISLSRDQANAILRKVLIENPSFLGTYTAWEPEAFDGADLKYVGGVAHDSTGRFIPYWVRGDDGIIHTEALTQYEKPGAGDWYIMSRQSKSETVQAPLFYIIQGQQVVVASFVVPIVVKDKFYGVAGVNAPIGFVQQLVDGIDLYDGTTQAALFTDNGTLIAVRQQPDLTNKSADLVYADFAAIQPHLESSYTRVTPDGKYLQIFSPIEIGGENSHWILGLIIPFEKITAPATTAAVQYVLIGTGLILLALVLLWLLAGQVVRPMQTLTNAATAVAQGDWSIKADIHSNDEAEVLANAFNTMTSELQSLFGTLEQRVAERTKALETVAEISTAASTILETNRLLQEVVDLSKDRFGFYHAHIYLLNEASDTLVLASGAGEPGRKMVAEGRSIPLNREQSLVARAAREKKGVTVNDVTESPDFLPNPLLPDTRSEMAVPMLVGDQTIGVFDVQSDQVGRFTDADINIQVALAAQVASSVQNARLYTQAENTRQEAQSLIDLALEGIAILDLETMLWVDPNENFAKSFGMSVEEIVKVGPKLMSPPKQPDGRDTAEKAAEMINIAMQKGSNQFEWTHTTAQGNTFPCEINFVRLPGSRPRLRQSLIDITERKRNEELTRQRAYHQEALNTITQKIQSATSVEAALQITARELGHALGKKQTLVALESTALSTEQKSSKESDESQNAPKE